MERPVQHRRVSEMSVGLAPQYNLDQLFDMAKNGWESVLDSYLSPFTWIAAIVTSLVIIVLSLTLLGKASAKAGIAFFIVGELLAIWTWWQIPYAILAGYTYVYLIALGLLIFFLAKYKSPWSAVAIGLGVALFTGAWWLYPESFLWMRLF